MLVELRIKKKSYLFEVYIPHLLLVVTEVKEFQLWSQVEFLYSIGFKISFGSIYRHVYAMSFILMTPMYFVAKIYINPKRFFCCCMPVFHQPNPAIRQALVEGQLGTRLPEIGTAKDKIVNVIEGLLSESAC